MFWNKNKNRKELAGELIGLIERNAPAFSTAKLDVDREQALSIWNSNDSVGFSYKYFFEEHGYYVDKEGGEKIAKEIANYYGKAIKPVFSPFQNRNGGDRVVGYMIVSESLVNSEKEREERYKRLKHC